MLKKFSPIFVIFFVISCGFQVIYDEKKTGISYEKELAAIKIQKSEGRLSQEIRNSLYDLFNPDLIKVEPKYILVLNISESISSTFLTSTGASGRNKVTLNVSYNFIDFKTGKKISSQKISVSDNYDVQINRYATEEAEEYTKSNLSKIAAQNIRNFLVNDIIEFNKKENLK